jgi:hypothetical protein
MALSELAALEAAYQALQPLDAAGRRRALQWLSDALDSAGPLAARPADDAQPDASRPENVQDAPEAEGTAGRRPRRGRTKATPSTAPAAPSKVSAGRRPAPAASPRRRRSASSGGSAPEGRAYRRMPPAEEVMATYAKVGTISGLAEHYDVPRHTAQGWARQLRRQGYAIGRNA